MKFLNLKRNRGFALLFSVLISSLLLTIGLSIFNIALKELSISSNSRQSVYAFYAADSGRECALYWDTKSNRVPTLVGSQTGGLIVCGGRTIDLDSLVTDSVDANIPELVTDSVPVTAESDGPNFNVLISKSWDDINNKIKINTSISSIGHDTIGNDRVEREIQQNY